MIIDAHAHVFPEQVAEKAVAQLELHYGIKLRHDGTVGDLKNCLQEASVDYSFIFSAATKPEQVISINSWIYSVSGKQLIPFATLHPDFEQMDEEIRRIKSMGYMGVKLHPDFQQFFMDEERALDMYSKIAKDFIIIFHVGDDVCPSKTNYTSPGRLANVLSAFPEMRVIAAHMGGYQMWNEALEKLAGKNVFFDTSSSIGIIDRQLMLDLIREHGPEKILFGTDYPFISQKDELVRLDSVGLNESDLKKIKGENALRLLHEAELMRH